MPDDDPCPEETKAYDDARDAYDEAWWNELAAELNIGAAALSTVGAAVGTAACFGAVGAAAPGTFGASTLATAGCYGAATATVGGAAWTASAWIAEGPYEKATAAAKEKMNKAGQDWCDCAGPGGTDDDGPDDDGPDDTPDDDGPDDRPDDDGPDDTPDDECECEEGDFADQTGNYAESPEADDTALMSVYDPNDAP
jgi:hypothetical protein